jgi:hypothetical protein
MRSGAKTVAIVMPSASPVMTTPIPRLRCRTGVVCAISARSLEKNAPSPSPVATRIAMNATRPLSPPVSSVAIPAQTRLTPMIVRCP